MRGRARPSGGPSRHATSVQSHADCECGARDGSSSAQYCSREARERCTGTTFPWSPWPWRTRFLHLLGQLALPPTPRRPRGANRRAWRSGAPWAAPIVRPRCVRVRRQMQPSPLGSMSRIVCAGRPSFAPHVSSRYWVTSFAGSRACAGSRARELTRPALVTSAARFTNRTRRRYGPPRRQSLRSHAVPQVIHSNSGDFTATRASPRGA